ncbi:MAG: zinc-binding alcohol dehydrogenase family protein [Bacteroidetes bacterium]|nr:zinc-binding alcohol dehydrogenase family protein [Bacteroidota bacterium]
MNALVCIEPGQFEYKDIDTPIAQPGQTLLRIKRIGICGTDLHAFEGTQPFFSYPRILGHELAAEIIQTDAEGFLAGELVTIIPYFNCGTCIACRNNKPNCCTHIQVFGVHINGAMQEIVSVPSYSLVHTNGLSLDAMALVEPLAIGAHGVNRAGVKAGEFVLVVGAGPIGLGTMEMARMAGAKVIAMDINSERLNFCKNTLQIPYAINPRTENALEQLQIITNGDMPTVVIDATGYLAAINQSFQYLAHGGRYVLVGLQKADISFSHPEFHKREASLMSSRNANRQDFETVIQHFLSGEIDASKYITHRVSFNEVKANFASWILPETGVIKAMVAM